MDYSKFKGIEVGMRGKFWNDDESKAVTGELDGIMASLNFPFHNFENNGHGSYKNFKPMSQLEVFADECRKILPTTIKWFVGDHWICDNGQSIHSVDVKPIFPQLPDVPEGIDWKETKIKIHD